MNLRMISLALLTLCLFQGCSKSGQQQAQVGAQPSVTASPAQPDKQSADVFLIKGILIGKDGAPASGKTVIAYPLNGKAQALIVQIMKESRPGWSSPELWNPKSESDASGRFTINLPRVSRIGKDAITEVALSLSEPAGGWTTMTVADIQFADQKKTAERCFVATAGRQLPLLSNGKESLKVKIEEKAAEIDLGRINVN